MLTAAVFEIKQQDILTASPINPLFNVQTDAVRVRGFEFEAEGQYHPRTGNRRRLQPSRSKGLGEALPDMPANT